jgi:hypothetical protein
MTVPAPLSLWLVFSDPARPGNGELRLADSLLGDPRYRITRCFWASPPDLNAPLPLRAGLALENALVPSAPTYEATGWAGLRQRIEPIVGPSEGECDVIVDFSHAAAAGMLAGRARHGLWRLDAFAPTGGVGAALRGDPATRICLTRTGPGTPEARLIAQAVYDTKFLAMRNRAYVREKSVQLIERELARLHRDGAPADPGAVPPGNPAGGLIGYGTRAIVDVAGRLRRRRAAGAGRMPRRFCLRVGKGDLTDFDPATAVEVAMPDNHLWADPFLIRQADRTFCFFEDYDYASKRGHIGVGCLSDTGFDLIGPAHVADHHLSYPFVFHHDGEIYMMPETHQANRLEIWRATDFPTGWELHATAFDGVGLADSVLVNRDGAWWLFTNICRDGFGDYCAELHLFRLSGPDLKRIEPHPLNPVVIGADTARGAGRIHAVGDRLLRLSQDNSGGVYGYGLNVMQIDVLNLTDYAERRIRHITPDFAPGLIGCHHMDTAGGHFVIDVRKP